MFQRLYRPLVFVLLAAVAAAAQAQSAPSLQQSMGSAAFRQAGLDKLSPQELHALEQWLSAHPDAMVPPPSQASSAAVAANRSSSHPDARAAKAEPARTVIASRVAGRFGGWQRGTVLTLENGQRWQVVDDSSLSPGKPLDAPAVTIKPGMVGGWLLKVEGYNASARVKPAN
ncbi:MAG: hypothetical protein BGP10_17305 [Rhodanobacter sp. 68-29]|nr:hypothetical protein [Rhodanobacter sp.]ODU73509.1 MAG: hypothetical protein ABT17_11815 [Rhodanobacter sp. SCN 69-32]OJY55968.1 MAG: hypothetical protein BGP10_17305 [Rhodanobacter sp. 68-29]